MDWQDINYFLAKQMPIQESGAYSGEKYESSDNEIRLTVKLSVITDSRGLSRLRRVVRGKSRRLVRFFLEDSGKMVIEPQYDFAYNFEECLAMVRVGETGNWGFIDKSGKFVLDHQYLDIGVFSDGFAAVRVAGAWGFIDKTGKPLTNTKFEKVYSFSDGLAAVKLEDKWGYVNKTGKIAIER